MHKWIITTCRDRLSHLARTIPTWLTHLPDWRILLVCCDDPRAVEYSREHFGAQVCVLAIEQGRYFNKLAALQAGAALLEERSSGSSPEVDEMPKTEPSPETPRQLSGPLLALVDLDMLADETTARMFARLTPNELTFCGWGTYQDLGFFCADAYVVCESLRALSSQIWEGYGPEDLAIRLTAWHLFGLPLRPLPAAWRRIQHPNSWRTRHHSVGIEEAVKRNRQLLEKLTENWSDEERKVIPLLAFQPRPIGEWFKPGPA
jgi:hypothetical protein